VYAFVRSVDFGEEVDVIDVEEVDDIILLLEVGTAVVDTVV
jgi:hypothetical protein